MFLNQWLNPLKQHGEDSGSNSLYTKDEKMHKNSLTHSLIKTKKVIV